MTVRAYVDQHGQLWADHPDNPGLRVLLDDQVIRAVGLKFGATPEDVAELNADLRELTQ